MVLFQSVCLVQALSYLAVGLILALLMQESGMIQVNRGWWDWWNRLNAALGQSFAQQKMYSSRLRWRR